MFTPINQQSQHWANSLIARIQRLGSLRSSQGEGLPARVSLSFIILAEILDDGLLLAIDLADNHYTKTNVLL